MYTIVLNSQLTNKEWIVTRKFSESQELNNILSDYYSKIPFFPKRSSYDNNNSRELELRKILIEKYLNVK